MEISGYKPIRLIDNHSNVWLAQNTERAYRPIKITSRHDFDSPELFEREYETARKLQALSGVQDGLIGILEVGRDDAAGHFYCIMEMADDRQTGLRIIPDQYVPKSVASEWTQPARASVTEAIQIGLKLSLTLGALHKAGFIHGNLGPAHILWVNGGAKLAGLGLVTHLSTEGRYASLQGFVPLEGSGTVRADIYGLGMLLYMISTGNKPEQFPTLPEAYFGPHP
jgi:serine/threonine protein kinase